LFTDPAVDRITEYSGGIPRRINILCDHCLLFGYADEKRRIDRHTVNQAIEYLEEGTPPGRRVWGRRGSRTRRFIRWAFATLSMALASTAVGLALRPDTAVLLVQSVLERMVP
jgi:hypothetical protein